MEKYNCKLCFKQFSNGKALGGHMKSHMSILQTPPPLPPAKIQLTEMESASSTEDEEEEVKNGGLNYRLRENPKKSFRLVDPVFSSPMDTGSIVVDRESETDESFKNNPTRRRSKRNRKSSVGSNQILKKPKIMMESSSPVESEPAVSSVSDTTPDEDVARCLMMLSRDVWMKQVEESEDEEKSIDDESEDEEEEIRLCMNRTKKKKKNKYQCESCKKFFRSYQALGGHRANHKKVRSCILSCSSSIELQKGSSTTTTNAAAVVVETDQKFHECPICFKVFKNRQALGGHKRSHQSTTPSTSFTPTSSTPNSFKFKTNLIDLNFPAPIEDEDVDPI